MAKNNKYTTSNLLKKIKAESSISKHLVIKVLETTTSDISNPDELSSQMSKIINCTSIVKQKAQARVAFTIFEFCILNDYALTQDQLKYLVSMFENNNIYMSSAIGNDKLLKEFLVVYTPQMAYKKLEQFKINEIIGHNFYCNMSHVKRTTLAFLLEYLIQNDDKFGESLLNRLSVNTDIKTLDDEADVIHSLLLFCANNKNRALKIYSKKLADDFIADNYEVIMNKINDLLQTSVEEHIKILEDAEYWFNDIICDYGYDDFETSQLVGMYLRIIRCSSYDMKNLKNVELTITKSDKEDI